MIRTQIYLDEELYNSLKKESLKTGKSMSQLIREKLRKNLNKEDELIKAIDKIADIWSYQTENVEDCIKNLRKGSRLDNF